MCALDEGAVDRGVIPYRYRLLCRSQSIAGDDLGTRLGDLARQPHVSFEDGGQGRPHTVRHRTLVDEDHELREIRLLLRRYQGSPPPIGSTDSADHSNPDSAYRLAKLRPKVVANIEHPHLRQSACSTAVTAGDRRSWRPTSRPA
jgi:hypothetical protein